VARIGSLVTLNRCFDGAPGQVKLHYSQLPALLRDASMYETALAYSFLKTEQAQNRILYGGAVKLHRASSTMARSIVETQHLTRKRFKEIFENIFGTAVPDEVNAKITFAEGIRDKIVHGKVVQPGDMRDAIADVLDYAVALNDEVHRIATFRPFGDMRGFKGRAHALDTRTTKWLMKGLGFGVS